MWTVQGWYDEGRAEGARDPQYHRDMAELTLTALERELPGVPCEEIARRVAQCSRRRLDALPSLATYPELRGMPDLIEARRRGLRDGAGLSEAQSQVTEGWYFYYCRYLLDGKPDPGTANCSAIFFPRSDAGPLYGKNLDTTPAQPNPLPAWPAVNEHLFLEGVSSGVPCDEESPEIFPVPIWKLIGRYCRTAREAVEMMQRYNLFWGPGNQLLVDRQHNVAMIEKTACRLSVRWSTDGFGYVTAMTQEDPELRAFVRGRREESLRQRGLKAPCADTAYWAAQDRRRELMNDLMAEAKRNPCLETLRAFLQHRSERGFVAGDGDVLLPGGPPAEHTTRTTIWLLREGKAKWWRRESADGPPSWQCPQPDGTYEGVWTWD